MKRIMLQAGHQNAPQNCDINLRKGTGAPGEVEFTVRIRDAVSRKLLEKRNLNGSPAFQLYLVDATANCDPNIGKQDYDLFLPLHYDADIYGKGGGFADFPQPSTDHSTTESQRITKVFNEEYFKHSGIEYINRSNANTRYYYMWKFLSAKTPCVILECGVGQNAHDKVILQDTERVANAIVRAICKAFNVPFETSSSSESPSISPSSSVSSSISPSSSESASQSPSSSESPSISFSPSHEDPLPPDDAQQKLDALKKIINSDWSFWFFMPNYWRNKLQELRNILNG